MREQERLLLIALALERSGTPISGDRWTWTVMNHIAKTIDLVIQEGKAKDIHKTLIAALESDDEELLTKLKKWLAASLLGSIKSKKKSKSSRRNGFLGGSPHKQT